MITVDKAGSESPAAASGKMKVCNAPRLAQESDVEPGQTAMEIAFWGTRGSYPVPGGDTLVYGGNTACHSLRAGGRVLVIDAGTGIIGLGKELVKETSNHNIALFLSHNHLDHTSGLLYFKPNYRKTTHMHIFGPVDSHGGVRQALDELTLPPSHPVPLDSMGMMFTCKTIGDGDRVAWRPGADKPEILDASDRTGPEDVVVRAMFNRRHPVDGVLNFRVEHGGKAYVYATDVEGDEDKGDPDLAALAAGADLLAHDGQYTSEDYQALHRGWGHSTPAMAVKTATMAGVKRLAIIHHEPGYDDAKLAAMEAETKKLFPNSFFAREGQTIRL